MERLTRRIGARTGAHATDDPEVEAVQAFVTTLYATAGQARLYGAEHRLVQEGVGKAITQLHEMTQWLGTLTLTSSFDGLFWREHLVAQEGDDRKGIGRHLHLEGISEVTFNAGVEPEELASFLSVLRVNLDVPLYEEETLESLLWQAELANIGFRAIAELMEAEALSGQMDADQITEAERVKQLLDLQPGDLQAGRALMQQLRDHRMPGLGDVVEQWGLSEEIDARELDDDAWKTRFLGTAGDDLPALLALRNGVANERSSQLVGRAVRLLLKASVNRRPELRGKKAMELASGAMRQLYILGDAVGVREVLESGHRFAKRVAARSPEAAAPIEAFLRRTFSPIRLSRMLRHLDPEVAVERETLVKLATLLPDAGVLTFFDVVQRDEERERSRGAVALMVEVSRERIERWMQGAVEVPMEQLLPVIACLQLIDDRSFWRYRAGILRHPSPAVREAAVSWFATDLPDEDVRALTSMLIDRSAIVRDSAARVLSLHRPPVAVDMLRARLTGDSFATVDPQTKRDVCVAFGRIAGPSALPTLEGLLGTRSGLLASDEDEATADAAALGIGAVGTANALRVLEKGARALGGAKRRACQFALQQLEAEKRRA